MKNFLAGAATAVLLLTVITSVTEVRAQESEGNNVLSALLQGIANGLAAEEEDKAIRRAYEDVFRRDPSDDEMRRYRQLMHERHWTEDDVRRDLRDRTDYRRYSAGSNDDVERIVRRAFEDILDREPGYDEMRDYRSRMVDDDWTEYRVREDLRRHGDHARISADSADRIVRRAYLDIFGRDPDYNGLVGYRNQVMNHGWDEHDVRQALLDSPEYRVRNRMSDEEARAIVRRVYLSLLSREPDASSAAYVDKVINDHWSEQDVAREIRNSAEYRSKHRGR